MNKKTKKTAGVTLLEFLIALVITALISVSFHQALSSMLKVWRKGGASLKSIKETHIITPILNERLKNTQEINLASLSSNNDGYIRYTDNNNIQITIYKNTAANKIFGNSTIFTRENTIAVTFRENDITSDPELLFDNVTSFNIQTFNENASYTYVASANNQSLPINYDEISSIKITITRTDENNNHYTKQNLINLTRERLALPGTLTYGLDLNENNFEFPFNASGFSTSNAQFQLDPNGIIDADSATIAVPTATVKISNTGLYFSSIQEAINAAVSGNEILVAANNSGYDECIILVAGIKLYGGYESYNWSRDINQNETTIVVDTDIGDTAITFADNTIVDGFTLDGNNLLRGAYANNVTNFTLSNCKLINSEKAIDLNNSKGKIYNNNVTSNTNCLYIKDCTSLLEIERNRFYNTLNSEKNIYLEDSLGVYIRNNIIENGSHCIYLTKNDLPFSACDVYNNIIKGSSTHGIDANSTYMTIANNVIFQNYIGVHSNPSDYVSIDYNLFFDWGYKPTSNVTLGVGNIVNEDEIVWNASNPYFDDIITYVLKASSGLIDAGKPTTPFNDAYLNDNPSKGTALCDIGLYGGPKAGRVLLENTIEVNQNDSWATLEETINSSWPADHIKFNAGSFSISSELSFKPYQQISGISPEDTVLSNSSGYILNLNDNSSVENLCFDGTAANANGISITNKDIISIKNCLFMNQTLSIDIDSSTKTAITNSTFINPSTAIDISGVVSNVSISNCIISTTSIGINGTAGIIKSNYNYFHNTSTPTTGGGTFYIDPVTNITDQTPLFFNNSDNNFYLHPSSNAIESIVKTRTHVLGTVTVNMSPGCFEYYIVTGSITSPLIDPELKTAYKNLSIKLFGETTPPSEVASLMDGRHSDVNFSLIFNGNVVTTSPTVEINSNNTIEYDWVLPPTAIFHQLQIQANLRSYRFNRTPYINQMILSW